MSNSGQFSPKWRYKIDYKNKKSLSYLTYSSWRSMIFKGWRIVVGKKSYKEQIEESKRRIHLLDSLQPKSKEEAKEQEETLRYLEEHLG